MFIFSLLLVFISSYLIVSCLKPKENYIGINYFFLAIFAQVVLTFEILSLFSAISINGVLIANLIFFTISTIAWLKNKRPIWKIKKNGLLNRFFNSLKFDKSLRVLFFGYVVFIISALLLCALMPVNNADAFAYHISRCLFWISNGNLNHFVIGDIRNTTLPINSEILYAWIFLFTKKDLGICFISFLGYVLSMMNIFVVTSFLGFSTRRKLWIIFILSALPSVMIQASTTETDLIIAWLTTASFILFWYSLKHKENIPVFMSALAYSIAIGVKPTSIMMIPPVGAFFVLLSYHYKNFRNLFIFLGFGVLNFIVFSSYNYILNLLDFGNIMGCPSFININKNFYGIKGAISNFIKHMFMFINFSGFKWGMYLESEMTNIQNKIFTFLHLGIIPDSYFTTHAKYSTQLYDSTIAAGVLGFLVVIPCAIRSLFSFKPVFKKKFYLSIFALIFFANIFILSFLMNYSVFDCRYLVAFIVFSSPIIAYSYGIKFKPLKIIIILFALFSFLLISTNLKSRPLIKILQILSSGQEKSAIAYVGVCKYNPYCEVRDKIKEDYKSNTKILVFAGVAENIFLLKTLEFDGYTVDFNNLENTPDIDFNKYNFIVITDNHQNSYYRKDAANIKNLSCNYLTSKDENKSISFFTSCDANSSFFFERNYIPKFYVQMKESAYSDIYYVYENTKNPAELKY